jgi:N-acetylmuramate 1-kinase
MSATDPRLVLVHDWVTRELRLAPSRIEPASSDASFRRYFRVSGPGGSFIVMDAPPGREDVRPYLAVSALLEALGAHVPKVHEADAQRGLLLLEDLGSRPYLPELTSLGRAQALYGDALAVLADIQAHGAAAARQLPPYDREALGRELALMPEWFCRCHLGIELSGGERDTLAGAGEFLILEALAQPQVFVHRDYHSRNLMITTERSPGVIDFQDALRGPLGYDLVSLLKDCYIGWPRAQVEQWVRGFGRLLAARGFEVPDQAALLRGFDLIGVQRHLKVLGIFARLWYRDGKPGYIGDLPLTLRYVTDTCARYPELADLGRLLELRVVPELARANARVLAAAGA